MQNVRAIKQYSKTFIVMHEGNLELRVELKHAMLRNREVIGNDGKMSLITKYKITNLNTSELLTIIEDQKRRWVLSSNKNFRIYRFSRDEIL